MQLPQRTELQLAGVGGSKLYARVRLRSGWRRLGGAADSAARLAQATHLIEHVQPRLQGGQVPRVLGLNRDFDERRRLRERGGERARMCGQ